MSTERIALIALALMALPGCRETVTCQGSNTSFINGTCGELSHDDGGGIDASDAGPHDAGTDAFNACASCSTIGQVCSTSADAGLDAGEPQCVDCVRDEDCRTATSDAGGRGTEYCQDFTCRFGCRMDSECGTGGVCLASGHCSAYPSYDGSNVPCSPCDTDRNCNGVAGYLCVQFSYQNGGGPHVGDYCLRVGATCGPSTTPLGLAVSAPVATSVDGMPLGTGPVCGPRTSCEALLDATSHRHCAGDNDCGLVGFDDGVCRTSSSSCTLLCSSTTTCPTSLTGCTGAPAVCVP